MPLGFMTWFGQKKWNASFRNRTLIRVLISKVTSHNLTSLFPRWSRKIVSTYLQTVWLNSLIQLQRILLVMGGNIPIALGRAISREPLQPFFSIIWYREMQHFLSLGGFTFMLSIFEGFVCSFSLLGSCFWIVKARSGKMKMKTIVKLNSLCSQCSSFGQKIVSCLYSKIFCTIHCRVMKYILILLFSYFPHKMQWCYLATSVELQRNWKLSIECVAFYTSTQYHLFWENVGRMQYWKLSFLSLPVNFLHCKVNAVEEYWVLVTVSVYKASLL